MKSDWLRMAQSADNSIKACSSCDGSGSTGAGACPGCNGFGY